MNKNDKNFLAGFKTLPFHVDQKVWVLHLDRHEPTVAPPCKLCGGKQAILLGDGDARGYYPCPRCEEGGYESYSYAHVPVEAKVHCLMVRRLRQGRRLIMSVRVRVSRQKPSRGNRWFPEGFSRALEEVYLTREAAQAAADALPVETTSTAQEPDPPAERD